MRELGSRVWAPIVPLGIGPFTSRADVLHFAALLEAMPEFQHVDLIDAEPWSAFFIVHGAPADAVAAAVSRTQGYQVVASTTGGAVTARIDPGTTRALQVSTRALQVVEPAPRSAAYGAFVGARSRRSSAPLWRALAVALMLAAVLLIAWRINSSDRTSQLPAAPVVTPPVATAAPPVAATAAPVPTTAPVPTPVATPTAGPVSTATPPPPVTPTTAPPAAAVPPVGGVGAPMPQRFVGTFSGTLGIVTAMNGCEWDTPFDAILDFAEPRPGGEAAVSIALSYVVTHTPAGAACSPSVVDTSGTGDVTQSGDRVRATLTGERDLLVRFVGTRQGDSTVGTVTLTRTIGVVSPMGNTAATRTVSIPGVRVSAVD